MKNSAWYQQLWKKKFDELPLTQDAENSWLEMKELLETTDSSAPSKSVGAKIVSFLTYVLPVAAMIFGGIYLSTPKKLTHVEKEKVKNITIGKNILEKSPIINNGMTSIQLRTQIDTKTAHQSKQNIDTNKQSLLNKESFLIETSQLSSEISRTANLNPLPLTNIHQMAVIPEILPYTLTNHKRSAIGSADPEKKIKQAKVKKQKEKKIKNKTSKLKEEIMIPSYSYGITAGLNGHKNKTLYFGGFFDTKLGKRVTANAAIQFHSPRTFNSNYTRESYFRPDSTPAISFSDTRKIAVLEVPLTLSYHLSNKLKIHGGPVISLPLKQRDIKLGLIASPRDTLFNGKQLINEISNTEMKKINYGFKAGVGLQLNQVGFDLNYQVLNRYELKNAVGSNKHSYNTIQLGITYRLNNTYKK
ncbi:MAG: hypothetical protein EOO92_02265 [Pedobacter sp.]|nr:MAG: hypothetical protein EOO92_02265 [Pedobacter sp.]